MAYDPFVGTGGLLVAASHYGAVTLGMDIDIRVIRTGEYPHSVPLHPHAGGLSTGCTWAGRVADCLGVVAQGSPISAASASTCTATSRSMG